MPIKIYSGKGTCFAKYEFLAINQKSCFFFEQWVSEFFSNLGRGANLLPNKLKVTCQTKQNKIKQRQNI